jgi:hypothetical protein
MTHRIGRLHASLAGAAILAMLAAIWAGWIRLGWDWPAIQPTLPAFHGPLMVGGFLGTLISLERAVAVKKWWAYLAPIFSALGGLMLIAGLPAIHPPLAALLLTFGSAGLVVVFLHIVRLQQNRYHLIMALGAGCWLVGNLLWTGGTPIYRLVLWWAAFLILTICAERLELGRLVRLTRRQENWFLGGTALLILSLAATLVWMQTGTRLVGVSLIWLSIWLWQHDLARRTIRTKGLPRFAAACLLGGYTWLGLAGAWCVIFGNPAAGTRYDAMLHMIFLGFVMSMIFGHAPIIFPAVLNLQINFQPILYSPLILLHASLALRILADLLLWQSGRLWGGLLNGIAILGFFVLFLASQPGLRHTPATEKG